MFNLDLMGELDESLLKPYLSEGCATYDDQIDAILNNLRANYRGISHSGNYFPNLEDIISKFLHSKKVLINGDKLSHFLSNFNDELCKCFKKFPFTTGEYNSKVFELYEPIIIEFFTSISKVIGFHIDFEYEDGIELFGKLLDNYVINIAFNENWASFYKDDFEIILKSRVFVPSSPMLKNLVNNKFQPFACYLTKPADNIQSIMNSINKSMKFSNDGGGVACDWSLVRPVGTPINGGKGGYTSGIIPFMNAQASCVNAIAQGGLRGGALCTYLDINHPEIHSFIEIRNPRGGDESMKIPRIHHGVIIDNAFMESLKTNEANRELFSKIIKIRMETGEPYIFFKDNVVPYTHLYNPSKGDNKDYMPNLCTEVILPVKPDGHNVCCLGSIHFGNYFNLSEDERIRVIKASLTFLRYVASYQSDMPNEHLTCGLGVFGFYEPIIKGLCTFEEAKEILIQMFSECKRYKVFSHETAIAPTASISKLFRTTPCLESIPSLNYINKSTLGNVEMKFDSLPEGVKTNFEMSQRDRIDFYAEVQKYVDQGISFNLYYDSNTSLKNVIEDHIHAWRSGIKTLYYLHSKAGINVSDTINCNLKDGVCSGCEG